MQSAKQIGYTPGWVLLPTVMAMPYTFTTFGGYNWTSYVGGEIRNARTRMSWTIIPTAIISIICFAIMGFGIYHLTGFDFYNGIQWVYYLNPSAYPKELILPPVINYFIFFATKNSAIVFFILFTYVLNGLWIVPCLPLFLSRVCFAWSFDRILPSKLAEVSERFHVPLHIIGLEAVLSFIVLYVYLFTSIFSFAVNVYMGWMICYAIVGLAITIFPYRKKTLFETTVPTAYKRRIGGIPLLSILGAAMFCVFIFMTYACATNAAIGGPLSWASFLEGVFGILILGTIIFYASSMYHKRKGVDISLAFGEIPPE